MKRLLAILALVIAAAAQEPKTLMVSIDFDDGYRSAYIHAVPILDKAGFKSDQFIITGFIGAKGYVTKSEILSMEQRGHEIGAHTRNHPHLNTMSPSSQREEIAGSKLDLEVLLDHPVLHFAYPYGDYDGDTLRIVREAGFQSARTVNWGDTFAETNPLVLPMAKDITSKTTFADLQHWIENANKSKRLVWVIFLFHRVDEDDPEGNPINVSSALIQQLVDYLVQQKIRVVTHTEALQVLGLR